MGIAEERFAHLFERFYSIFEAGVQPESRPSVGLGLYLSQHIIASHVGYIEVQSTLGQGSTFSVVLPRYPASSTEQADDSASGEGEPSPFQNPQWLVS